MPGKVVHFELPADNVERAKTFYMKAFGWEINQYPGMQYHMVGTTPSNQQGMPTEPGTINGGLTKPPARRICPSGFRNPENYPWPHLVNRVLAIAHIPIVLLLVGSCKPTAQRSFSNLFGSTF